jgi:predicted dinucleotide-binding enzyme
MTRISIIGAGNMAAAIGGRAARAGHVVEVMSRNRTRSESLAAQIGHGATAGTFGERPRGEVVVLAVLHAGAVDAVSQFGGALSGTTVVDITNPFNADGSGLVTSPGDSMADRIAAALPEDAHVVKAFNTIYGGAISGGKTVDAFFAGDDAGAKARVAELLGSLGMRPLDAGGLEMAHALEWAGLLLVGLSRSGAGFDVALAAQPL